MKIFSSIFNLPQGDSGNPGDVGSFGAQGEKVTHKSIICGLCHSRNSSSFKQDSVESLACCIDILHSELCYLSAFVS